MNAQMLEPCPFCGPGQSQVSLWFDDMSKRWRVGCGRCGCSTGTSPRDKTEAPAIKAWNTRPHCSAVSVHDALLNAIDSPTVAALAEVFSPRNTQLSKSYSQRIVEILLPRISVLPQSAAVNVEETPQDVAEQAAYFDAHAERFAAAHAGMAEIVEAMRAEPQCQAESE